MKYDNSFRVIEEVVNDADTVKITYDKDDNIMRVGAYAVKQNTLNGMVTSDTVGTIITDYTYNTVGELTGLTANRRGTTSRKCFPKLNPSCEGVLLQNYLSCNSSAQFP